MTENKALCLAAQECVPLCKAIWRSRSSESSEIEWVT